MNETSSAQRAQGKQMYFTATEPNLTHPAILGTTRKDYFDLNSKVKTFSPSVTTVADNPDFS